MKRHWPGVFVAVGIATTAVLGAQAPPQANTPPQDVPAPPGIQRNTPAPQAEAKGNTVTIAGCIQDAPMPTASAALPAPAGADKIFYLNNPAMAAAAGNQSAVGTSGLSLTGFRLEGDTKLITPHLNHQVRITGNVQSSAGAKALPTLKVESVAMVAAKCDPAK